MKKTSLLLLAIGTTAMLAAQPFSFRMSDKTNKKAYSPTMIHMAEAAQDGQLLIVEPELKAVSGLGINPVKGIKVRLCDSEWNDAQSVSIPDTKGCSIGETFRTGNILHTLLSRSDKELMLRHLALDAQTLAVTKDEVLFSPALSKGDEGSVWTATSPNGQYTGAVCAVWPKKGQGRAVAMMFDRQMNKLWEQQLTYSDIYNVIVTDDGTIATLRLGMVEDNHDLTAFRANIATADGVRHGEFILDADVSDVALLRCEGSRLLAVALEGRGGYGLLRMGRLGHRDYTGLCGLVFDLDQQKIAVANRQPFTSDDISAFVNEPTSGRDVKFVEKVSDCQTATGGAVLYQHRWEVETRNMRGGVTTSSSTTVYSHGIMVVQADMNGDLTISYIMQNNQNAGWPKVGAEAFALGDKVCVLTNESKEETDAYTPLTPAKRSKSLILANTALAAYWFTRDGQGAKQMLEKEEKALLLSHVYHGNDGRYYLLAGATFPHIVTISTK